MIKSLISNSRLTLPPPLASPSLQGWKDLGTQYCVVYFDQRVGCSGFYVKKVGNFTYKFLLSFASIFLHFPFFSVFSCNKCEKSIFRLAFRVSSTQTQVKIYNTILCSYILPPQMLVEIYNKGDGHILVTSFFPGRLFIS